MKKCNYILLLLSVFFIACINQKEKESENKIESVENIEIKEPYKIPFEIKNGAIYFSGKIGDTILTFLLDNQYLYDAFDPSKFHEMYNEKELETWLVNDRKIRTLCKNRIEIFFDDYTYVIDTVEITKIIKEAKGFPTEVIGSHFFKDKTIEIDFEEHILLLYDNLPAKISEYKKYDLIPKQEINRDGITIVEFTDGNNTIPATLAFDLGSDVTMITNTIFNKINIELSKKDTTSLAYLLLTDPTLFLGAEIKATSVETGEKLENIYSYWGHDGAIGIDFLRKFNVIFDYERRAVYLKKNN